MGRWCHRLRHRLRALLWARDLDGSLQREIQQHIDEQIDENMRSGMSAADARAAALRAFGPAARVEEECRDVRRVSTVHNLLRDLRYTLRSLSRQPLLVAAATLSIAVAVGANTTIFVLANELLLATPTTSRPAELVHIQMDGNSHASYRQWRELDAAGALQGLAGYQIESEVNWLGPERSVSLIPLIVTANYFDLLGVPVAMGRGFSTNEATAERQPALAVVSHSFWRMQLGADPTALGRSLVFNGRPYTLIGVLPAGLRALPGYGVAPDVYLPITRHLLPDIDEPHSAAVALVGRLRDGQSVSAGRAALAAAGQRVARDHGDPRSGTVTRFAPVGTLAQLGDFATVSAFFGVLLVGVALLLTIACANVAGLLLARSAVRRREIAVRVALGASRARLMQQLLTEGLWLAAFGTLGGVALMLASMQALSRLSLPLPLPIELHAGFDLRVLIYLAVLVVLTTILSALTPALQATRPSLMPSLKHDEPRYLIRRLTLRNLLVVGQLAVAMVLLASALLFLRNVARAASTDPGFDAAHTIVAQVGFVEGEYTPESRSAFLEAATARLGGLDGVASAAFSGSVPLTIRSGRTTGGSLRLGDRGEPFHATYEGNAVGPDYFRTMGIALRRGREFRAGDRPGAPAVAIVNEEFVRRHLGGADPLGAILWLPSGPDASYPVEIVGVVANSRHRTIGESQRAAIYESFLQRANRGRFVHLLIRASGDPAAAAGSVQRLLGSMDPHAALEVQPMRAALSFAFMPSRIGSALFGALGALGLALAVVGLYGVVSYAVSRRTAEIGIRMALGASRGAVLRMVLRDAGALAAAGIAIGLALAVLVTRPLAMFLVEGLSPGDPVSLTATALALGLVSLAAAATPARRAMRIDPAAALREE